MDVIAGSKVDIVLDIDWSEERIDVRRAIVYDVDDKSIILSQTSPPIASNNIGNNVKVTYLVTEKDGLARHGITARVAEIATDYRLASSETVEAVVLTPEPRDERFNLRLFYRLEPPTDSGIELFLNEEKVNIFDISIGGAKFTHSRDRAVEPKGIVKLTLKMDELEIGVEAQVVRTLLVSGRMAKKLEGVAVQFLNLDTKMKDALSKKIRDIERELLYKETHTSG